MNIGDRVKVVRSTVPLLPTPGVSEQTRQGISGVFVGCTGEVVFVDPFRLVGNDYLWVKVRLTDVPFGDHTVTTWFHDDELVVVATLDEVVFG